MPALFGSTSNLPTAPPRQVHGPAAPTLSLLDRLIPSRTARRFAEHAEKQRAWSRRAHELGLTTAPTVLSLGDRIMAGASVDHDDFVLFELVPDTASLCFRKVTVLGGCVICRSCGWAFGCY